MRGLCLDALQRQILTIGSGRKPNPPPTSRRHKTKHVHFGKSELGTLSSRSRGAAVAVATASIRLIFLLILVLSIRKSLYDH